MKPKVPFIPIRVTESSPSQEMIHLEFRRPDVILNIDWPASQVLACTQFLQGLLR